MIRIEKHGDTIRAFPSVFLDPVKFQAYLSAATAARTGYDPKTHHRLLTIRKVAPFVSAAHQAGFQFSIDEAVRAELLAFSEALKVEEQERINSISEKGSDGLRLFPYQREGAAWLRGRSKALLADIMGCVDGEAEIRVSRAGKGFAIRLADLHRRFNGGGGYGKRWSPAITTYARALCGGELRLHKVVAVISKGARSVVKVQLRSGKILRLTPDHEILTPAGFAEAQALRAGDAVLTNGQEACIRCGGTENIIIYVYAKFRGYCRECMYRYKRVKGNWSGGRFVDCDGYVRISGQFDHHRAGRYHFVYEHIVVMEKHLGRKVCLPENVHHINGDRADNRIENLQLVSSSEHHCVHSLHKNMDGGTAGRGGRVKFIPEVDTVVSVIPDGETEVYDMVMDDPYRNFVANGVVVHNCGKTIEALMALPQDTRPPVVVICPAVVKGSWKFEIGRWRQDYTTTILSGRQSFRWPIPGEVVVTNWDILPPLNAEKGAFDFGCPYGDTIIIGDEAHAVKSSKTKRAQRFRVLTDVVFSVNGRVWLLTGTPLLNHPLELWNVLGAAKLNFDAFGNWQRFVQAFNGYRGRFGYQWGEPQPHVPELLKSVSLRRDLDEVLPDLPEKMYNSVSVKLDDATTELCDGLADKLVDLGVDFEAATDLAILKQVQAIAFEEVSSVRAAVATAKIPTMLDLVAEYEEQEEPLVVFSCHRAPIDIFNHRTGWVTITGDTPAAKRSKLVEQFQAGGLKGIALTIQAGGTGITLTKAHHMLFVDLAWTPALNSQAESRCLRIGQKSSVLVTRLVATHRLDQRLTEIIAGKQRIIYGSTEAKTDNTTESERVRWVATLPEVKKVVKSNGNIPSEEVRTWAGEGLFTLAALDPDRAAVINDVGFNGVDGNFGHSLAGQLRKKGTLSCKQWWAAIKMLKKYHRQIGKCPE